MRFSKHGITLALITSVASLTLLGCNSNPGRVEQPITVEAASAKPPDLAITAPVPPPAPSEIQQTVSRVFGDDVIVTGGEKPIFLAGDFNGDASTDLAIVVKPATDKLADINAELANWSVQDPHHSYVPPKDKPVVVLPPAPKPEKVKVGESLLAVIHGQGPQGWRDPLARQAYLLKEATGPALALGKPSEALVKDFGVFPSPRDVISENFAGKRGVIYWTGAAYAWHREPR